MQRHSYWWYFRKYWGWKFFLAWTSITALASLLYVFIGLVSGPHADVLTAAIILVVGPAYAVVTLSAMVLRPWLWQWPVDDDT